MNAVRFDPTGFYPAGLAPAEPLGGTKRDRRQIRSAKKIILSIFDAARSSRP
jgi:hypothetical protein